MFEKLYLIQNPLTGARDWVSEREFTIGSQKLKDVFGVLYLSDVKIMLQYNQPFKEAIMKEYHLKNEASLSLAHVCHMISLSELKELMNVERDEKDDSATFEHPLSIETRDGQYNWDEEKGYYESALLVSK